MPAADGGPLIFMIDRSLNYGRDVIRRFLAEAGPLSSVLDMGAGSGDDLSLAKSLYPRARLLGIETLPPAVRALRERGVRVISVDLERERIPLRDASMDAVVLNQVLEHVKELFWILHEATRVLKPGGSLIVGVPNLASLHNRFLLLFGRQPSPLKSLSAHVRGFTRGDLAAFLEGAWPGGYRLEGFAGSNFYPFPPVIARPLARAFPSLAWGIFFRWVKTRRYQGEFPGYLRRHPVETSFFVGPSGKKQ